MCTHQCGAQRHEKPRQNHCFWFLAVSAHCIFTHSEGHNGLGRTRNTNFDVLVDVLDHVTADCPTPFTTTHALFLQFLLPFLTDLTEKRSEEFVFHIVLYSTKFSNFG
jgi:hypothetical protein